MKNKNKGLLLKKGYAEAARLGCPAYMEQDKIARIYCEQMLRYSRKHGNPFDEKDAEDYIYEQFSAINALHAQAIYPVEMRFA